ncbi:hypothetical protein TIFTF001_028667 [Ficus carica]|uniref:Folylpolyglutamate synthase n=1 Tax=Ficus carica TaxID=3494 RepID=A0AA88J1G2_FICCA|nr:hypothetical protein TIFTF001_028667 [Ficus carica]
MARSSKIANLDFDSRARSSSRSRLWILTLGRDMLCPPVDRDSLTTIAPSSRSRPTATVAGTPSRNDASTDAEKIMVPSSCRHLAPDAVAGRRGAFIWQYTSITCVLGGPNWPLSFGQSEFALDFVKVGSILIAWLNPESVVFAPSPISIAILPTPTATPIALRSTTPVARKGPSFFRTITTATSSSSPSSTTSGNGLSSHSNGLVKGDASVFDSSIAVAAGAHHHADLGGGIGGADGGALGEAQCRKRLQRIFPCLLVFASLVLLAFKIFAAEQVDVAILEVGIGGKLDPTNVVQALVVCGISSLGYDHMEILGLFSASLPLVLSKMKIDKKN